MDKVRMIMNILSYKLKDPDNKISKVKLQRSENDKHK